MSPQALAVYGLTVGPNQGPIPASTVNFPARFRITMAAIDPTASPEADEDGNLPSVPRSTLKLIRLPSSDSDDEDEDDEDEDDEYLKALINADDSDSDEENGGPSDPEKKKKRAEALAALIKAAQEEGSDEEMADAKPNGKKASKGKGKAVEEEEDEEDSDDEDDVLIPEEFVLCTLDTERTYQQPLDVVVREDEEVFFLVTGTHAVTLTGNYVESLYDSEDDEDDEDDEDMDDDMLGGYSDEDSDDLDDVSDPRVTELDSEDESDEAPALVPAKKGKNKRAAEEATEGLDALIAGAGDKDEKLSKKQAKKLKNNKGEAVASEEAAKKKEGKDAKKVQFAKELEQGPTGSTNKEAEKKSSVRVVQGITIDDRKVGSGRSVKNGDTVGMRYIGKLQNGKQFDANKKGKPFSFKIGKGEVIKGWEVGILGMAIGGERRLTVPASAAYGSKALPGIPGNSTLIFDVKLLEIK